MKSFLQTVTEDIIRKHGTNLSDVVVIFPNKRASLFMNQHLLNIVQKPLFSPRYMTISELFRSKSNLTVADDITSICTLYNVYQHIIPSKETIDNFWGWGEVMLSDFDDIDKHLGRAELILRNVRDLHAYDNIDYLTEEMREMLKRFFSEFSDSHDSLLKQRFKQLWNHLFTIYRSFNEVMKDRGLAYEGAMYREVAEHADEIEWKHKKYIFVGFNMLWEAEQKLFATLRKKGLAHFYWDFDYYYTKENTQEAGRFIRRWLQNFPNELDITDNPTYNNFASEKNVTFLSATTENIQARYIGQWLKGKDRFSAGKSTAIVLADESLLKSVIHYLPQEVSGKVNITIGFPLSETLIVSFTDNFLRLHLYNFNEKEQAFLLRQVKVLLNHPYIPLIMHDENGKLSELLDRQTFTIGKDELCQNEVLQLLFEPVDLTLKETDSLLVARLLELLRRIGVASERNRKDTTQPTYEEQLMQESIYRMYSILNRVNNVLDCGELTILPTTLLRLIDQITASTTMPFHGEPVAGLQITGMLETRNLDFDHLLILSCNEGNIPRGVHTSSFLPYTVRKAHNLTTPESKVAGVAYYFYRLLQRCGDISIAFNSSTDNGKTGQMSRFMLQIMAEADRKKLHLTHKTLISEQMPHKIAVDQVEKTDRIMHIINQIKYLSPSAINKYMRCPMQFYYDKIVGIKEPDSDNIVDSRMFGTILHAAAERIYSSIITPQKEVTKQAIETLLNEKSHITIRRHIDEAIGHALFQGGKPHYDGLQLINREVINHYIVALLQADSEIAPLFIEGLEAEVYGDITFEVNGKERTIQIGGFIDRLDRIITADGEQVLRVIDYKTGNKEQEVLTGVEEVFNQANIDKKHSDYYLQAMLYSILVRHSDCPMCHNTKEYPPLNKQLLAVRPALLFVQKKESRHDPVLKFKGRKEPYPINDILDYEDAFRQQLRKVIAEIFDPHTPFAPTAATTRCEYCAFAKMCKG